MLAVVLALGAFACYIYGVHGYRGTWWRPRYANAIIVGAVLDWSATFLMPTGGTANLHALVGWLALGLMTLLAVCAALRLQEGHRWTWNDKLIEHLGYPFLCVWILALLIGAYQGVSKLV